MPRGFPSTSSLLLDYHVKQYSRTHAHALADTNHSSGNNSKNNNNTCINSNNKALTTVHSCSKSNRNSKVGVSIHPYIPNCQTIVRHLPD